jgi:hypothetical protein
MSYCVYCGNTAIRGNCLPGLQTDTDVRSSKICDADQLARVKSEELSYLQEEEFPVLKTWQAEKAEHEVSSVSVWPQVSTLTCIHGGIHNFQDC